MAKSAFILALLLRIILAQANENECKVYTFENCILGVRCKIKDESVEKRRSFTLSRVSSTGEEETVAQMSNVVGFYQCETARNYTCGKENDTDFLITLPCTATGELTLSDNEHAITCMHAQSQRSTSESNQSSYKKNDTSFQNDTDIISEAAKTAIAVSVCLIVMITICVICFIKRKEILKATRNIWGKEVEKDCDGAECPLNSNNTVMKTTTPDKQILEQV